MVRLLKKKYAVFLLVPLLFLGSFSGIARALSSVEIKAQVNELQAQIAANDAKVKDLQIQSESLKRAISAFDVQIASQELTIQATTLKIADLTDNLTKTQAELDRQKELLKESIRALYKKGGASTVELLIGSDSFSQFIDSQEYFNRLKTAIQESTNKVIILKQELQKQQLDQEALLKQQQVQKQAVEGSRSERQNLLVQTQGDEVKYKNYVADLKTQQIEANKRLFAQVQLERGNGNNGGYTYNDWPYSMRPGPCMEGDGPDRWGYCTRQCVSYAAWAVERSGRNAPIGFGDARMWVDHGIPQYNIPKKGDVGINTGGHYGHAMYVEDVYSDGSIRISQYNADGATGRYSEATLQSWQSSAYVFLRFP